MMASLSENPGPQGAFRALADPTRRRILLHLSESDLSIGEIADRFEITRAAIRKHLTILEQGDLIRVEARGRERINRLRPEGLRAASDWINTFSRFWDDRLEALKLAAEKEEATKKDD